MLSGLGAEEDDGDEDAGDFFLNSEGRYAVPPGGTDELRPPPTVSACIIDRLEVAIDYWRNTLRAPLSVLQAIWEGYNGQKGQKCV